jgi:excinuclease ABC subunit A
MIADTRQAAETDLGDGRGDRGEPARRPVIRIRGARVHNLKNVDLDIERGRLTVITGPSGSGKSSLAFDTLFAEGQRQYIETLSNYARQFLNQLERPDVDLIDGLQPTICIDQRPGSHNPRSTVATVTEIHDYLRLLLARLGDVSCHACGARIQQLSPEQIEEQLLSRPEGTKMMILAPLVRGRRGQHRDVIALIRKAGFVRARVDGLLYELENIPELEPRKIHHVDAVVDRVIIRPGIENRISESTQLALKYGDGLLMICYHDPSETNEEAPHGIWRDELFSVKCACPECGISYEEIEPRTFSFNSPYGACPECEGLGRRQEFDVELVIPDGNFAPSSGALAPWSHLKPSQWRKSREALEALAETRRLPWDRPWNQWTPAARQRLLQDEGKKSPGLLTILEKEYVTATRAERREELEQYRADVVCSACGGSRLGPAANSVRISGKNMFDLTRMNVREARQFFGNLTFAEENRPIADPLLNEIRNRLDFLEKVGVDYLTLNRSADTLSGGELQRVRLATSIGSALIGVCYVLDEPSIGLHPRDNDRLIEALRDLQSQGNSVVVVEHDEATMRQADEIIDVGPRAGSEGGEIVAQGTPQEIMDREDSITGGYLKGRLRIEIPARRRPFVKSRTLVLEKASANNLRGIDVTFPLQTLTCVTGVSGSGKSSLITETLARALQRRLGMTAARPGPHASLRGTNHLDKLIEINQSPIGRTPRSNPATYMGAFDEVRKVFAEAKESRQRGFRASRFSFNVKGGRCEHCQGQGVTKVEMNFLADMYVVCSECQGARFNRQTLEVQYRGRTIADVLAMSVDESSEFFANFPNIHRPLTSLQQVGLGYLRLGQPSNTLSGGEAQRIKLAAQLARVDTGKTMYLLDEPTTGLHFDDIRRLLGVLQQLVDRGNTVIVVEHNLEVIKSADWIIDLGPEGGEAGGCLVAVGTPEQVAEVPESHTGKFLKTCLIPHEKDHPQGNEWR